MEVASADANSPSMPAPSPVPMQLLELAVARQITAVQNLTKAGEIRPLIDEPMLTISTHGLEALRFDEGRIVTARAIDIVENSIRYVAQDDRSQAAAFEVALQQGIADCVLERTMLEEFWHASSENGTGLFRRAQLEGRPVLVTTPAKLARLEAAGMAGTDVSWMRSHESKDVWLVVAQPSGGRAAWWSVRPDGNAVLRVSGGEGQSISEKAVVETLHGVMSVICGYELVSTGLDNSSWQGTEKPEEPGALLQWTPVRKAEFVAKRMALAVCVLSGIAGLAGFFAVAFEGFAMVMLGADIGVTIGEKGFELGMAGVEKLEEHYRKQRSGSHGSDGK